MQNYSKLIGTIVAFVIGLLITKFALPADLGSKEVIDAITLLIITAFGTYLSPPNKPSDGSVNSPALVGAIALVIAGSMFLGGCADFQKLTPKEKAQAVLQATCDNYKVADAAFQTVVASTKPGTIPANVIKAEAAAVAALEPICNPIPSNAQEWLAKAGKALGAVLLALQQANDAAGITAQ